MAKEDYGPRKLREWRAANAEKRTQMAVAQAIGASAPSVGLWEAGACPKGRFRAALAILLNDPTLRAEGAWREVAGESTLRITTVARIEKARAEMGG